MSLKVEQKIIGNQFTDFEPKVYATVAYLVPMMINIRGEEKWIWVLEDTDNDIFFNNDSIL